MAAGIDTRHARACRSRTDGRCNCQPTFQAHVFDKRTGRRIRRTFPTHAAARTWRQDALVALRRGNLTEAQPKITLKHAAERWLADARAGIVTTRSGDPYKPAAIRSYAQSLALRVYPTLGDAQFYSVRRVDLQDLVDQLVAAGHAPATVQGPVTALRAIYKRALTRGEIDVNPTSGLKLPAVRSRRERFASPDEARKLIAALPASDRAVWATALYTGLRRGELMALPWEHVDLDAGTIHVVASWDVEYGPGDTKNRQRRKVPIPGELREHLLAHRLRQAPGVDLAFGTAPGRPFTATPLAQRADQAWKDAGLPRITLHECRHTYAAFAIAAGVNAKALCDYMGHSSIKVTYDKYGHLMPGNEQEAAGLLDAYLSRATVAQTVARTPNTAT
jgi:integrase